MAEVEALNPQFKWSWRKTKRVIKRRAKRLTVGTYALGCRGHPGIVIKRTYWPGWSHRDLYSADVEIKSLIDGVEEGCSVFSCAPMVITKERALEHAEYVRTRHAYDVAAWQGYPIEKIKEWHNDWVERGVLYYVLSENDEGRTVRSGRAYELQEANDEVERLKGDWFIKAGITNPRVVEMLSYPAPPTVIDIGT